MKNFLIFLLLILSIILIFAILINSEPLEPLQNCDNSEELNVYCDFMNPEDLALTPDGKFLIIAEFGGMAPLVEIKPGKLSFFNIKEKVRTEAEILFKENEWGSSNCSRASGTEFGPHGIDLIKRNDGKFQLAVVSHYPEETIEMFELKQNNGWMLEWKGCIKVENKYYFNDVSLDKAGNFYATHMFDSDFSLAEVVWNIVIKSNTGLVVKWNNGDFFEELPFTAGSFPNGIALDKENNNLVVNYNLGDKSVLFDLDSQKIIGTYTHNSPDNVVIKDKYVWVTNHDHAATDTFKCSEVRNCTLPFSVNKLSLEDLSLISSYKFQSENMGTGTVGLPHNGSLWIGSYHSDRLAEASLSISE